MKARDAVVSLAVGVLVAITGCGGESNDTLTIFLKHSQEGQKLPVLASATRSLEGESATPDAVLSDLLEGPTESEKRDGFLPSLPSAARVIDVQTAGSNAVVSLSWLPPDDLYAAAATVYSLTELPGIETVSLRLDGEPCCVYDQQGDVIDPLRRNIFRGWPGEPCDLRTYTDAVACRD
jgi:hypothetical protein